MEMWWWLWISACNNPALDAIRDSIILCVWTHPILSVADAKLPGKFMTSVYFVDIQICFDCIQVRTKPNRIEIQHTHTHIHNSNLIKLNTLIFIHSCGICSNRLIYWHVNSTWSSWLSIKFHHKNVIHSSEQFFVSFFVLIWTFFDLQFEFTSNFFQKILIIRFFLVIWCNWICCATETNFYLNQLNLIATLKFDDQILIIRIFVKFKLFFRQNFLNFCKFYQFLTANQSLFVLKYFQPNSFVFDQFNCDCFNYISLFWIFIH